jgi:hypothetical protein
VIRGEFGSRSLGPSLSGDQVDLYSNAKPEFQGESWLGQVARSSSGDFEFIYKGNLLGRYVTATSTIRGFNGFVVEGPSVIPCGGGLFYKTSEFTRPILVTR